MEQKITKRYFATRELKNKFPPAFNVSKNPRYIIVRSCKCLKDDILVGDLELHADFVVEDPYCDHYVCNVNEILTKPIKYEYNKSSLGFNVWFTNMYGEKVDVDTFLLHLLLIY